VQADQSPVPQRSFFKQTHMLGEKERKQGREGALYFIKAKKLSVIRSTLIYLPLRKRKCCRQSICEIRTSFHQSEDTSQFQICQNVGGKSILSLVTRGLSSRLPSDLESRDWPEAAAAAIVQ